RFDPRRGREPRGGHHPLELPPRRRPDPHPPRRRAARHRPPQARGDPRRWRPHRLQLRPPPRRGGGPGDPDLPRRAAPAGSVPGAEHRQAEAGSGGGAAGVRVYSTPLGRGNAWVTEVSITGWLTTMTVRSSSAGALRLKDSTLAKMASTTSRAVS